METIAWLGFSHGMFTAIVLLSKKRQSLSDKILSAWVALLAIEFLTFVVDYKVYGVPLLSSSFLLLNPAFYIYSSTLVGGPFKLRPIQLLHLVPFLLFEILAYVIQEPYRLTHFFESDGTLWFRFLFGIGSIVSWIGYNWATFHLIFRHRERLKNEFSTIESNKRIGWLVFIVLFYNLYCLAAMAIAVLVIVIQIGFPLSPVYNYSAMLLFILVFGIYGLRQEEIYTSLPGEITVSEKYSKSGLAPQIKVEIQKRLLEYFTRKRPYLNPELNMTMLSDQLNVPKHQLTEVLNSLIGKNFFQFVNEYRVEAVKKMLVKNPGYSIEAIGYECGFNSKSSFFTVFKNISGVTPMQYKQIAIQQSNCKHNHQDLLPKD
jgi:AraC-like DNA-binding protein